MTKLRVVSPPSFLADLFEGPIGKTLNCIQLPPGERYDHCISFVQHTRSPKRGLFLSLQNRKGRHNHGMWWETFWGAASTIGHAWGDTQDDEKAFEGPFEEWAREEVASLLSGRIRSRLTELLESIRPNLTEEQKKEWLDACRELQEASKHPDLEGYSWSEALECTGLLLEASRGAWSPSRLPSLKHAVSEMSGTLIQNKGFFPLFLKRAGISTLLPSSLRDTLLAPFVERVEDETREVLEAWMNQGSSSRFGAFKKAIDQTEQRFNDAACALLNAASEDPEVQNELTPRQKEVQGWIHRYNALCDDFRACEPKGERVEERARELIELETQLNHYWSTEPLFTAREIAEEVREPADLMPTRDVLNAQAIERAVDQGRFLSSGTAGVVGWLRNQKRYGEAIAILEAQFALPEVCALRNRSHGYAFECLLNNGFGNYADSSDPEHHRLGARAIHVIESFMTPTTTMVQWQFSCVLAQAGESGKALDYVEAAVANRASARRMARDGDLASVVDHPRFVALLDAERSSAA